MENQSQNQLLPEVEKKIITLRNQQVILDADVAELNKALQELKGYRRMMLKMLVCDIKKITENLTRFIGYKRTFSECRNAIHFTTKPVTQRPAKQIANKKLIFGSWTG